MNNEKMRKRIGKQKQREEPTSPQKCPLCEATVGLTVAVVCVPDGREVSGGRVVWDENSGAECTACGFVGKVVDFL
jgi:hypothetical protein